MDKEKAKYVGVIWSDVHSLEGFAKALNQNFSQPIHEGLFVSALGQRGKEGKELVIGASPDEVLTVLVWTFAGIGFVMEMPDALGILKSWLNEVQPEQVIAFAASHKDLLEPLTQVCRRCGHHYLELRSLRKAEVEATRKSPKGVPAEAHANTQARAKIVERMKSLRDMLATALSEGDKRAAESALREMGRLRNESKEMSKRSPVLIRT